MNLEKLSVVDPELKGYIDAELNRQRDKIELIASENIVTPAVMEAMGSVLTNKYAEGYPALLVELKWNQSAEAALAQIKEKKYPESLVQYTGNILLVGINYDKKNKKHQCLIEEMKK